MDLWLIAVTAATGYVTKHFHNVSKAKEKFQESSSEDLSNVKLGSSRSLVRAKKPKEGNFGDCLNGDKPDLSECVNTYGVEVTSRDEESLGNNDEILSESFGNRAFIRRHRRYGSLIKPFCMENGVMSRLHREQMSMEDYMRSPFPSPCGSVSRPLIVSDGTKVLSKKMGDCSSQLVPNCGIPQLRKLESSVLYVKRRDGKEKSASRRSDHRIGSNDGLMLLCVGISIGIMSSFVATQTEVNKVKETLKQPENMVKDSDDELKKRDLSTVKDDLDNGEKQRDEKTADIESISNIEAELEAELKRLEININSPNELESVLEVDFAQGELRDDLIKRRHSDETESNQEPSGNFTPKSGNYMVPPRELSLRLHEIINSRYEERIKELEIALQESQRKVEQLVIESAEKKKPLSRLWGTTHEVMKYKSDSNLPASVAYTEKKQHNPVEFQPLVMDLAGEALDAFNESYDELMVINDYSEDDVPFEIHENDQQEELSLTSKSSPWSHKHYTKDSSRTSEDVNFSTLQGLLGLSDEEEEEFESEMEKQLIKQIVEKTKQGSPAVLNAQKMLFLMEETEQNP